MQMLTRGETDYTGWGQVRARSGEGTFFPPCSIICLQERQVQIFWTTLPAIDITNHHQTKEVPCDCCEREIWCQLSSLKFYQKNSASYDILQFSRVDYMDLNCHYSIGLSRYYRARCTNCVTGLEGWFRVSWGNSQGRSGPISI